MLALLLSLLPLQVDAEAMVSWNAEVRDGKIILSGTPAPEINHVSGTVQTTACQDGACFMPEEFDFDLAVENGRTAGLSDKKVRQSSSSLPSETPERKSSLAALILEAILWGFAMLLTPCVFPMVPMTVSFFIKGSGDKRKGRFRAIMYGVFIILLYTVPISIIIGATWLFGGAGVTADIFNWVATHWLPNILFFLVFLVFALSFFGLFEITLPSSWVNSADGKSDRKGLGGVFFMALTLVLVSFSCTGPIVGTVLIKSTSGEFWAPMVTMLAFSTAFALPFALLALFPSLLKNLPKSGGWLNSVKVTLGFIELALGLKFLSVADQTYHWGILPRNIYLAIWIVLFVLLALYLAGFIRFRNDSERVRWSPVRIVFLSIVCAFVIYLASGFYGKPLKALSGYLPPIEQAVAENAETSGTESLELGTILKAGAEMSFQDCLDKAAEYGKPVFVDITGYGCVNCREMEARVWTDPEVQRVLREDYTIVQLFVDDKTKLPEDRWVKTPDGKVLKDVGRVNSNIALTRFGVNSQPNYFILDPSGEIVRGPYAYNLSVKDFLDFLN